MNESIYHWRLHQIKDGLAIVWFIIIIYILRHPNFRPAVQILIILFSIAALDGIFAFSNIGCLTLGDILSKFTVST